MENKQCKICNTTKPISDFVPREYTCWNCRNAQKRAKRLAKKPQIDSLIDEIWLQINNYEGLYEVSNKGRIKSLITMRILSPNKIGDYLGVTLTKNKEHKIYTIHRLVALHFIPNPENKPEVNHIEGIKTKNCVEDLEWATKSENGKHAYDTGLSMVNKSNLGRFGKDAHRKRAIEVYTLEGVLISTHHTVREGCVLYCASDSSVSNCLTGKNKTAKGLIWKYAN